MPRLRTAEQALSLLTSSSPPSQTYICRTCRQHLLRPRTLHTTTPFAAEKSFFKRIQESVFGTKESKEAERKREEARQKRLEELAKQSEEERAGQKVVRHWGRDYEVAAVVDESLNREYVPATTWEGLERIGSEAWVRKGRDGGEVYYGFAQTKKMTLDNESWRRLLHHVAVEVLALRQAGRDIEQVCHQRAKFENPELTRHMTIRVTGDDVSLASTKRAIQRVLEDIPATGQEPTQDSANLLLREAELAEKSAIGETQENEDWMQLSLSDPSLKLAILKRTIQLSGHRPRDAAVSSASTLAGLYDAFKTKEKPKKLAQSEQMHSLHARNPNVTVHASRRTPIHKHTKVGRWKVIEDELEQRGLPVTGSRWRDVKTKVESGAPVKTKKKKKVKAKKDD